MSKPLNIAVIAKKGGIGKTNVSIELFEAFRHVGKLVRLNDWDSQGTSTKAMRCFYPEYDNEKPAQPEIIIWDTPPSLEHVATATAARNADIAVVLTTPAPSDDWEAADARGVPHYRRHKTPSPRRRAKNALHYVVSKLSSPAPPVTF